MKKSGFLWFSSHNWNQRNASC